MENIERLESSIGKLLEAYRKLREENESLLQSIRVSGEELSKAMAAISTLKVDVERYERASDQFHDLDQKKHALKEEIRAIIGKIDKCIDSKMIDTFTNV